MEGSASPRRRENSPGDQSLSILADVHATQDEQTTSTAAAAMEKTTIQESPRQGTSTSTQATVLNEEERAPADVQVGGDDQVGGDAQTGTSGGGEGPSQTQTTMNIDDVDAQIMKCKAAMMTLDSQIMLLRSVSYKFRNIFCLN